MRWFVFLAVILLAALVLQAGLLAFAMYVLLGVLLLSRHLAKTWVGSIEAAREIEDHEPREVGESIEVRVKLRNSGKLTIAWVLVEDLLPETALRQKPPRLKLKGKRLKIGMIRAGKTMTLKYTINFAMRGYYQIGPAVLETGDLFGLHRRHRVVAEPAYVLVYPKVIPLPKYDFASQRPIGEVHLANRLFEDPTRNAGVRPYQYGDPLQRVHWRATARTGQLQSRVFDPTSLAGASILVDLHKDNYSARGEPYRSELVVTIAASLAYAVAVLNQQVGLASNGRDAVDRVRMDVQTQAGSDDQVAGYADRDEARASSEVYEETDRLQPVVVETRRGIEQFQRIREALARLELTDGLSFAQLVLEVTPRLPRDATVMAILPAVSVEAAGALGNLRRMGFAVTAIIVGLEDEERAQAHGRLSAEGVRDVRALNSADELALLGETRAPETTSNPYAVEFDLV